METEEEEEGEDMEEEGERKICTLCVCRLQIYSRKKNQVKLIDAKNVTLSLTGGRERV